ncbi:hypothetical protein J6590_038248 [Homalodisca vitripennis]|nr:hypothetical protein J6590_038248 [Homalodisca vitripennis]
MRKRTAHTPRPALQLTVGQWIALIISDAGAQYNLKYRCRNKPKPDQCPRHRPCPATLHLPLRSPLLSGLPAPFSPQFEVYKTASHMLKLKFSSLKRI